MLKKIYLGLGAVLLSGYLGWSLLGMEWTGRARDPDPTVYQTRSTSSRIGTAFGRNRGFHFGSGFGFGK